MAATRTLPLELLDSICAHLPPNQLATLVKASWACYHVAQRRLYRHIVLDSFSSNLSCVLTLARSPAIARHVRSFSIRLDPYAGLLNSFYRALAMALSNMALLVSLDICADKAASWVVRNYNTYPRLTHFASSFNLDHNVAHLLHNAPNLQELDVDTLPPDPPQLHPSALPALACFTGSAQAAQLVVPGRPVHSIHLNSGDLTEDIAENLARSTVPVHSLSAGTSSHSVALIGTLTRCMERLHRLRIVTTYNFSDIPDASYFSNITDALKSLPDLVSCEIWGLHWISSKKSFHDSIPFSSNDLLDNIYSDLYFPY